MTFIPNNIQKFCFISCDEMVIEAGLCHCANKFYEADTNEANSTKEI